MMTREGMERLFKGDNRPGSTVARLPRTCLQLAPAAQPFLKAATTHSAASQQLSPSRVARVPVLLKNLITRLAVVLVVTLCPALIAQAQVNVDDDLISFARWKSENGEQSQQPLYTLEQTGNFICQDFVVGQTTNTLYLADSLTTSHCQIGEGTGTGNTFDWDQMLKLTWQTKEACEANTQLLFGSSTNNSDGVIEVDYHSENIDCDVSPHTRNFALPALSAEQVNDGKIKVALGMDAVDQDKVIGYWTLVLPTPECSDVTDWDAAATEEGWSCTVDGKPYEYADFHILTTDGTDVCAARGTYLPTAEGDNQGLFCSQTATELRAIFNWNNGNRNIKLSWLLDVAQIGSRTKAGVPCGSAGETVANRCANQLNGGKRAFRDMVGTGGAGIRDLDTSNLDSFEQMFLLAGSFDQNLSGWNTANVTTMSSAFDSAVSFNQDLSGWDTSEVRDMSSMFYGASSFDGSLSSWNTSKVGKMDKMFRNATVFNRSLAHFNVALVTTMAKMFEGAKEFNQDISAWTTGNVSDMAYMFKEAKGFNRDLSAWNVARIARQPTDFFRSATGWTGTDPANNQPWCNKGQPRWGTDGTGLCLADLNFDVSSEPMELVETGESVRFTVTFSNESENDVQGATLKFSLPSGTVLNEAATPIPPSTNANDQLTWTDITVPKGSAGGALSVTLDVPPSYASSNLVANFVMEVSNLSVTATQTLQVVPGGEPDFAATLDAPNYALAGTELSYQLSVANIGTRDADNASVTLTWEQTGLVPESSGGNCSGSPLTCSWSVSLAAEDEADWDTSLSVKVPDSAEFGDVMAARLNVTDADSDATDSASATTTVDAQPDLVLVMTSSPRRAVAPGGEVEMTMALKNVGTAPAKNVVLTLPTDTATFASATAGGAANGDDVVWPAIASLTVSDTATSFIAKLTAGADDSVIQTKASVAGTTEGGASVSEISNLITLRVANEADPVLTAAFDPENFVPGKDIALTFKVANEGSAQLSAGTLVVPLPKDTTVATEPTGATCDATACSVLVAALAAGASSTASVALTVDAGTALTRLGGAGALKPDTAGAFIAQAATAEADLQITSDTKPPYEISIDPPAGSGCSLTSVSTQQDTGVTGFTLVRDELLNFSISGCETGASVPVAITVQGDPLPEGTVAIKTDESGASGSQISGATVSGNTLSYTLTDNGPLDLDPDDGEMRDPVGAAIVGGDGIYVPLIPVPIPYWVLGLLAGLMGWLGYWRLRAT